MGGRTKLLANAIHPEDDYWTVFNPCISWSPELGYKVVMRSSNYRIDPMGQHVFENGNFDVIINRMWMADLNEDLELENLDEIRQDHHALVKTYPVRRGVEDARVVWDHNIGAWKLLAVIWEPPEFNSVRLAEYELDPKTLVARLVEVHESPTNSKNEKNWMMPQTDGTAPEFDFVYSQHATLASGRLVETGVVPPLKGLHGGSQLVQQPDGTYYAVIHRVEVTYLEPDKKGVFLRIHRQYDHFFAQYSSEGALIALSQAFSFDGPGIEFAAGLVRKGDDFLITYGVNDEAAHLAVVPVSLFESELIPV